MTDTTTLIGLTFLVGSLTTASYLIGYLHGQHATIHQLAREINERNSNRKADWLKRQHRERDIT